MYAKRRFTLLEVVLALTILAIIAALAGSVLFTCQRGWATVRESSDELELRMRLDRIADAAFRNAIPFRWPDAEGREQLLFRGSPERVRLAYRHRINSPDGGGLRFLELFLDGNELKARHRRYPITGEEAELFTVESVAKKVRSLSFAYAVREGNSIVWRTEFETEDPRETIPAAIRMVLELENGETVQYLRRTAGNSFASVYGKYREGANAGK